MRNLLLIAVLVITGAFLTADINDPSLAVTTEEEHLIYNPDTGITKSGDHIFLVLFREMEVDYIVTYTLLCYRTADNGEIFEERFIGVWSGNQDNMSAMVRRKYPPSILRTDNGDLHIFYTNPETAQPEIALSSDNAETFEILPAEGLKTRSQYRMINTEESFNIVSLEESDISPVLFQALYHSRYSENDEYSYSDGHKYWGPDEYYGRVHINEDLWIQNGGGGNNNGWPTFHGIVTTNGIFRLHPTGEPLAYIAPMDEIFLSGWQEHAGELSLPTGEEVRMNGYVLTESESRDVVKVELDGSIAHLRYADWITHTDTFTVYNSFPDAAHPNIAIGDSIWENQITVKELDWDDNTSTLNILDSSVFVHCQLWIEGAVGSNQTWASSDTVYITGDIYYEDIEIGDPAEDSEYMFGLISEERMFIKYKYRDHAGEIHDDNCDGVYLYGCYSATGDGDIEIYGEMNSHYEGIFSYEYQHPHGSTPSFTYTYPGGEEWLVKYPDFHKFIYPPSPLWTGDPGFQLHSNNPAINNNGFDTCGFPYEVPDYAYPEVPPYGTDWPWYNPVYPESSNQDMGERGCIHTYGCIHQRRWGYSHRSGSDPHNHYNNEWDIENWLYGGTHGSTGYGRDLHYDERLNSSAPPNYSKLHINDMGPNRISDSSKMKIYQYDPETYTFTVAVVDTITGYDLQLCGCSYKNGKYAFLINYDLSSFLLTYENQEWTLTETQNYFNEPQGIEIMRDLYVVKNSHQLCVINADGELESGWTLDSYSNFIDFTGISGNVLHYLVQSDNSRYIMRDMISEDEFPLIGEYEFDFNNLDTILHPDLGILHYQNGEIVMQIMGNDSDDEFTYKEIYIASGNISEFVDSSNEVITALPQMKIYPNPFNPDTNISLELTDPGFVEIEIYNLKGQKVEKLEAAYMERGSYSMIWNAENFSSGIYLVQAKINGHLVQSERLTLLK